MQYIQEQDAVYAGKTSGDGIRNKEQHEGKGKGWACNNHNMCNPSLHLFLWGYDQFMFNLSSRKSTPSLM